MIHRTGNGTFKSGEIKVEFLGLPASGKTTIARLVGNELSIPVVVQRNSRRDLALRHPVAFVAAVMATPFRHSRWDSRPIAFELHARLLQQTRCRTSRIFEEGITFELWRRIVLGQVNDDEPWRTLLQHPSSDVVVVVDADDEIIRDRLSRRTGAADLASALAEQPTTSEIWQRSRETMGMLIAEVEAVQPVLRLRSDDPLRSTVQAAIDGIQRLASC